MSVIDSTFPAGNYNTLDKKHVPPNAFLSLNEVLKESLKKAQAVVDHLQLVVRCESLPQVNGSRHEMIQLFDDLLSMILNHPPNALRLFLYVYCEEESNEVIDLTLTGSNKRYCIKFHTNITTHESWKLMHSQTLSNCRYILSRHNGTLVVNDISNAGCLFSISLPGKIE